MIYNFGFPLLNDAYVYIITILSLYLCSYSFKDICFSIDYQFVKKKKAENSFSLRVSYTDCKWRPQIPLYHRFSNLALAGILWRGENHWLFCSEIHWMAGLLNHVCCWLQQSIEMGRFIERAYGYKSPLTLIYFQQDASKVDKAFLYIWRRSTSAPWSTPGFELVKLKRPRWIGTTVMYMMITLAWCLCVQRKLKM